MWETNALYNYKVYGSESQKKLVIDKIQAVILEGKSDFACHAIDIA